MQVLLCFLPLSDPDIGMQAARHFGSDLLKDPSRRTRIPTSQAHQNQPISTARCFPLITSYRPALRRHGTALFPSPAACAVSGHHGLRARATGRVVGRVLAPPGLAAPLEDHA